MSINFPNGLWYIDNGTWKPTTLQNAELFTFANVPVMANEPSHLVGAFNYADFIDPSSFGGQSLVNREGILSLHLAMDHAKEFTSSGYGFVNNPGVASNLPSYQSAPISPNGNGAQGVNPNNPFIPINPTPVNPNTQVNPNNNPYAPQSSVPGGNGRIDAPDSENYGAQFNARLSLIEKYCDKYGKIVDVNKIKQEYASKPQEGVEYCDDILNNKFDQAKLSKLVHKEYADYNKARLDSAKAVSDQWVETILNSGLEKPNLSASGVNENNVLDVVGTFMTNEEVKNGKVSLDNVFESPELTAQLIDTLKKRADQLLLDEDVDESLKDTVVSQIAVLRDKYDEYQDSIDDEDRHNDVGFNQVRKDLANGYIELFKTLRLEEAKHNDEAAPQHYGLPEDSTITFDDQQKEAQKEISSYSGRRRLNTSF